MDNENSKNPNLKHNKSLYEKRLISGVPSKIFVVAVAIVCICTITAGLIAGLVSIVIFIIPLIMVHKHDDQALTILVNKLKRPNFYSAGGIDDKKIKVVKKYQNEHVLTGIKDIKL